MNWLLFGSLLFMFASADEPPDQNPGKFGQQYEGDMVFTDMSGLNSGSHAFRGNEKWIWPDGNVYYRLASTIKADQTRSSMIREAMDDITREAPCVNFIDIQKEGASVAAFVDIVTHGDAELKVSALGCHSEVGYQGRRQILNLQPADCFNIATIKHELMHSLGCVHEHSRPDVSEALEILVENIHPNMRKNFEVEKYDDEDIHKGVYDYKTPYDIMSIMQYPANAFAFNDSLETMKPKDPAFEAPGSFGYSEDFSAIDIVELNLRYNCTLNTPLVFDYVNEYLDIIISRRRMDQYAIDKLEVQSKNDSAKISYLEDQVVKLKDQSKSDQQKMTLLEQRMKKLEDQSMVDQQKIRGKISTLVNDVSINGGKISTLENGVSINEGKMSTLENDILVNRGKIYTLEDEVSVNGVKISTLKNDISVNGGKISTLENDVSVNGGKISILENDVSVNGGKISILENDVSVNGGKISTLENDVSVNGGKISTLENDISINGGEISALENGVSVNGGKISALENDVTSLEMKSSFCGYHVRWTQNKNSRVITYQKLLVDDNNIPGASFSISTGQFTAGRTGVYNVQFSIGCMNDYGSDKLTVIYLRLNGVNIEESFMVQWTPNGNSEMGGGRSMLVNMASGDKLEAYGTYISDVFAITFCVSLTK